MCAGIGTAMHIDQIQIGFRYRKDLGDLVSLAWQHRRGRFAAPGGGHARRPADRRAAAVWKPAGRLGWTDIPVTVVDLFQAARGEAHENFVRKDLLPSEIVALKRAIEPLERRDARERQGTGRTSAIPPRMDRDRIQGDARDNIARYLGVGRTTIERAEAVVEAAEEEPEEYGHLVEQMDRSGKVAGAYRRLTVLRQARIWTPDRRIADRAVSGHRRRSAVALRNRQRPAVSDHGHRGNQGHARAGNRR